MNINQPINQRLLTNTLCLVILLLGGSAFAQTLYWDGGTGNISTNGDGLSQGAAGTWDNSTQNWDQGAGLPEIAWPSGGDAVFGSPGIGAGAGVVTLGAAITANSVTINTNNYIFTDGGASANTLTVNAITNAQTTSFSNNIVNSIGFTKGGGSTLTLLAPSPGFSGPVTVAAGMLVFGNQASATQTGPTGFGDVNIATNAIFKVAISNSTTYAQSFSGGGSLSLQGNSYKTFLTLGMNNTFTGGFTLNGCEVVCSSINDANPCSLGNGTNLVLGTGNSSTILSYQGYGDTTSRMLTLATTTLVGELDGSGSGPLIWNGPLTFGTTNAHNLTLGGSSSYLNTFGGTIADGAVAVTSLSKIGGGGIWMLTGSNTYSGGTTISQGLLLITNDAALGNSNRPIYLPSGYAAAASYEARLGSISNNVTLSATRTIYLQGSAYPGAVTVYDTHNLYIPCYITGTNGLFKYTSSYAQGWVVFTCDTNTYTGDFGVGAGNTAFTSVGEQGVPSSLGEGNPATGGAITLANAAAGTLRYVGTNNCSTHRPLICSGSSYAYTLNLDVTNTGTIAYLSTSNIFGGGKNSITLQGSNTGTNTLAQVVNDNGGSSSLIKSGNGQWLLRGANTYSGTTTLSSGILNVTSLNYVTAGTLRPNTSSSLGHPTTVTNGIIAVGSAYVGGTLLYTGPGETSDRVINLAGTTGGATLDQSGTGLLALTSDFTATGVGSKTLTLQGSSSGTGKIAGNIVNDSTGTNQTRLLKAGTGKWTLAAAESYTGDTIIQNGTLALSGSGSIAGSTNIIVNSNATFDVSGVSGGYTLAASQLLQATNGATATVNGSLNLGSFAGLVMVYTNGTPTLNITGGALTLAAGNAVTISVHGPALGAGNYKLISNGAGGSVVGTAPNSVTVSTNGLVTGATASLSISNSELYLVVSSGMVYPPVLSGINQSAGQIVLNFSGTNGQSYKVLASTNVATPLSNWVSIVTGTLTGLPMSYTNGPATNAQEFYIITSP